MKKAVFLLALVVAGCQKPQTPEEVADKALQRLADPMEYYLVDHEMKYPARLDELMQPAVDGKPYLEKLPTLPSGCALDYQVKNEGMFPAYTVTCKGLPSPALLTPQGRTNGPG